MALPGVMVKRWVRRRPDRLVQNFTVAAPNAAILALLVKLGHGRMEARASPSE